MGEKRKPGGQNGHEGVTLQRDPDPDKIEIIEVDRRTIPPVHYRGAGFESRQVIDIEIHRQVTEYRAEILEDDKGSSRRTFCYIQAGIAVLILSTLVVGYGNYLGASGAAH